MNIAPRKAVFYIKNFAKICFKKNNNITIDSYLKHKADEILKAINK
jgi:hypothetical protein